MKMKPGNRITILLWLSFSLTFLNFTTVHQDPVGKITFPLHRVFVLRAGSDALKSARLNMDVFNGDKVETRRESRCEITLRNGSVVRIDENSIYTLEKMEFGKKIVRASSFLSIGRLWSNIKKIFSGKDYFKVKSPSAVIAVRGTIYRIDALADSTTRVNVYRGAVAVSPWHPITKKSGKRPSGKKIERREVPGPVQVPGPRQVTVKKWLEIVKAQQQITVFQSGRFVKARFDSLEDAKSDWVRWNMKRDSLLQR